MANNFRILKLRSDYGHTCTFYDEYIIMGSDNSEWCLIESDPGVFEELMQNMGVKGLSVEEIYTMTNDELTTHHPIFGIVFLFKWQGLKSTYKPNFVHNPPEGLFFAQQMIRNACATQAILSVLLNINSKEIDIGQTLQDFKSFTNDFSPEMKGYALSNSDLIRQVHNSFTRPEFFYVEDQRQSSSEDAFHFIAYIRKESQVYELDGLSPFPAFVGVCTEDNWSHVAVHHIQERMKEYTSNEIRFNVMAICGDQESKLQKERDTVISTMNENQEMLLAELDERLLLCKERKEYFKKENSRRRHNFLPLIIALLKSLDNSSVN